MGEDLGESYYLFMGVGGGGHGLQNGRIFFYFTIILKNDSKKAKSKQFDG